MSRKKLFLFCFLAVVALFAVACSGANPAPSAANSAANLPSAQSGAQQAANNGQPAVSNNAGGAVETYKTQTVAGGSVTVAVTPIELKPGEPLEFDIAMNTHSVDLSNDMMTSVVLRDDTGKEYAPTAWDGPAGGGHHREGKIKFDALTTSTKAVTLIVKNIAGVPERTYKWDL